MTYCKKFYNMPVISLIDGAIVGTVSQLAVHSSKNTLEYVMVTSDDQLKPLSVKKVLGWGDYAITIKNQTSFSASEKVAADKLHCYDDFATTEMKVITKTGELVGTVQDVKINPKTYKVASLLLVNEEREFEISIDKVMVLGKDVAISKSTYKITKEKKSKKVKKEQETVEVLAINEVKEPKTNVQVEVAPASEPKEETLMDKQVKLLLNKRLTKNIYATNGTILFEEGTLLDFENIMKAQSFGPAVIIECSLNVEL